MLTPKRAIGLYSDQGRELPQVDAFASLYAKGVRPRYGDLVMVAGRSGTQKSGFALYWVSKMDIPTLYFSADMSGATISSRLASMETGLNESEVEEFMDAGGSKRKFILDALAKSKVQIVLGGLSWDVVENEVDAYVDLHDRFPDCVVFDNLMDFDGGESDYAIQMNAMTGSTEFARETGATTIILHHASDKSWDAKTAPWDPPARSDIKNGLGEKPNLVLGVALDPHSAVIRDNGVERHELFDYKIACLKQRSGPSDPTGRDYAELYCEPALTRFHES